MALSSRLNFAHTLLDLIIPLRCIKCGDLLDGQSGLCPPCWATVPFISKPFCACCGFPFEFEIDEGALCAPCSHTLPSYTTARSVFSYTPDSRDLILKFKHLDGISAAPLFAHWMSRIRDETEALCIPVPLHWTRLFMRMYNQAALLAQELAKIKKWTYAPTLLVRKKRTPSQGYLSKKERIKNVERAFAVRRDAKEMLTGKVIILVDDVMTSGATLNACAKTLLKAGAQEVHALTLGRVVLPQHLS